MVMSSYKQIISDALKEVVSEELYYEVAHDMHEVALCHRLAVHLEKSEKFDGYLIDCDYNRSGINVKRSERNVKKHPREKVKNCGFRPDIIVHKRGSDDDNLIMIEAKKASATRPQKKEAKKRLRRHAKAYNYCYAFYVEFPKKCVQEDSVRKIEFHDK